MSQNHIAVSGRATVKLLPVDAIATLISSHKLSMINGKACLSYQGDTCYFVLWSRFQIAFPETVWIIQLEEISFVLRWFIVS